jgi:hypothetical protein
LIVVHGVFCFVAGCQGIIRPLSQSHNGGFRPNCQAWFTNTRRWTPVLDSKKLAKTNHFMVKNCSVFPIFFRFSRN